MKLWLKFGRWKKNCLLIRDVCLLQCLLIWENTLLCSCWSVYRISVYVSFLLNQNISYMNFDELFWQDGTTQVLWIPKFSPSTVSFYTWAYSWVTYNAIDIYHSCNNSLPTRCKFFSLCLVVILLFSCRSFGPILLWWQRR